MDVRAVFRLLSVYLLAVGSGVALANAGGDVPSSLRAAIVKARYQIGPERKAGVKTGYLASNRAQGMRVSFDSSGILVSGASPGERWALGMKLKRWGYGKMTFSVRPAGPELSGDRIEYRRGPLSEWYGNSREGLEQGFTLSEPPRAGDRDEGLRLVLTLSGDLTPSLAGEGGGLLLARAGGERVLRFAELKAFDAAGRPLPARMELRGRNLALLVDDRAAVYPVTVDPLLTKETKLAASDAAAGDLFGVSVAVSGDTAVVGAECANACSGSASVFVRSGGVWSQQQKLTATDAAFSDVFGASVAISGNTAVIGAPFDNDNGTQSGSAYVFVRNGSVWSQQQKLTASDGTAGDEFGGSVAVNGDTAIVSAEGDTPAGTFSGSAYVFTRSGSVWSQQQKLTGSEAALGGQFGGSVALNADTAIVGAPGESFGTIEFCGAAYVFVRSGGVWSQQRRLTASDPEVLGEFGVSVAVEGDTALVGAFANSDFGGFTGAAYVFARSGGIWSLQQKLSASDAASGNRFGFSAALSGDTALVGAIGGPSGGLFGSAYLFARNAGIWSQQQELTASDGAEGDEFGYSVALGPDTAVIGVPFRGDAGMFSGSAYVYEPAPALLTASVWVGLKNSDDAGLRLDLLAEVFIDETKVEQGELDNVSGGSSGFNNAILNAIPLTLTGGPIGASPGARLSIKVSARRTCSGPGHTSGTARLWYNGRPLDTGASRDAGSRFDTTIGGITSDYFLKSGPVPNLGRTPGSSRTSADVFLNSTAPCAARPFTPFGTWSRTLP